MFTLLGRRSSWVSRWHALFSTAKDGDISGTPQGFLESGSAKVSNTSVKSSLLTFVTYPIECVSERSKPKSPTPPSQFEALPPGPILEITQYLSLSRALSLSFACRSFRYKFEARVDDLDYLVDIKSFLKDPKESEGERRVLLEILAFLCMLERDGRLSASKAVCGGCKTAHNISLFSSTALQQRPHQRLCMGREGILWIYSHRIRDRAYFFSARSRAAERKSLWQSVDVRM